MPARFPSLEFYPYAIPVEYGVWALSAILVAGMLVLLIKRLARPSARGSAEGWLVCVPTAIGLWIVEVVAIFSAAPPRNVHPITYHVMGVVSIGTFLMIVLAISTACVVRWQKAGATTPWMGLILVPVFCIFAFVVALFFPMEWHEDSRSLCRTNLRQIGFALHDDHDVRKEFVPTAAGSPPVSWRVTLLPLMDQKALYERYDQTKPWNDPANAAVARTSLDIYTCPAAKQFRGTRKAPYPFSDYVAVTGSATGLRKERSLAVRAIRDGMSNTIVVTEACGLEIPWAEPREYSADREPIGINLRGDRRTHSPGLVSSYHTGGGHAVMADGTTRFLSDNIDPKVLRALTTADGGEDVLNEIGY